MPIIQRPKRLTIILTDDGKGVEAASIIDLRVLAEGGSETIIGGTEPRSASVAELKAALPNAAMVADAGRKAARIAEMESEANEREARSSRRANEREAVKEQLATASARIAELEAEAIAARSDMRAVTDQAKLCGRELTEATAIIKALGEALGADKAAEIVSRVTGDPVVSSIHEGV